MSTNTVTKSSSTMFLLFTESLFAKHRHCLRWWAQKEMEKTLMNPWKLKTYCEKEKKKWWKIQSDIILNYLFYLCSDFATNLLFLKVDSNLIKWSLKLILKIKTDFIKYTIFRIYILYCFIILYFYEYN
jgi:hypothetical protein